MSLASFRDILEYLPQNDFDDLRGEKAAGHFLKTVRACLPGGVVDVESVTPECFVQKRFQLRRFFDGVRYDPRGFLSGYVAVVIGTIQIDFYRPQLLEAELVDVSVHQSGSIHAWATAFKQNKHLPDSLVSVRS
jgi:hypothetical protein